MHVWAVSVEYAGNPDVHPMLSPVVVEQCLGAAFAFIVAGARPSHVYQSAVVFGLRMDIRIAINFAGGRLQDASVQSFGEAEHVDRPEHARFGGLDGIPLVVDWRGGTGEGVNLGALDIQRKGYVVSEDLESSHAEERFDVTARAREEIINAKHLAFLLEQSRAQM